MKVSQGSGGLGLWQGMAILYAAGIFVLSSIPGLTPPSLGLEWQDKLYHFLEFALFSLALYAALRTSGARVLSRNPHLWAVPIGLVFAASDEIHQHFVTNRNGDFFDFCADAVGVILIQAIIYCLRRVRSQSG